MSSTITAPISTVGPKPPKISFEDLLRQLRADANGKEVQTAATYSHTWLANQFGHVCIGILAEFIASCIAGWTINGYRAFGQRRRTS